MSAEGRTAALADFVEMRIGKRLSSREGMEVYWPIRKWSARRAKNSSRTPKWESSRAPLEMETDVGRASRWNTLRALRVLRWYHNSMS